MQIDTIIIIILAIASALLIGLYLGIKLSSKTPVLSNNDKLSMLVASDRYKNSGYKIQLINSEYYVLNYGCEYVDLKCNTYKWRFNHRFYRDCKGSLNDVIKAFNELNPNIETITSKQQY